MCVILPGTYGNHLESVDDCLSGGPGTVYKAMTIAGWAKPDDLAAPYAAFGTTGYWSSYCPASTGGIKPAGLWSKTSGGYGVTHGVAAQAGVWQHLCGVVIANQPQYWTCDRSWYNGGDKQSQTIGALLGQDPRIRVGLNSKTPVVAVFKGRVAHVAVWEGELGDALVQQLAQGRVPTEVGLSKLRAYWPLVDSGVAVYANPPNPPPDNDLTLAEVGTVTWDDTDEPTIITGGDWPDDVAYVPLTKHDWRRL